MMSTTNITQLKSVIAPPFTLVTALRKVRLAEDAWNSRDPKRVALPTAKIQFGETGANSSQDAMQFGDS